MTDSKLLDCPFCGGSGAHYCSNDKRKVHYVACTRCGIEGIGSIDDNMAATRWNIRANSHDRLIAALELIANGLPESDWIFNIENNNLASDMAKLAKAVLEESTHG